MTAKNPNKIISPGIKAAKDFHRGMNQGGSNQVAILLQLVG